MRGLILTGAVLLLLGLASLFVPISRRERHGFDAGPVSVGVTTTRREVVHPGISAALIAAGVVLMFAGRRK
jgi:hypothetical protein